MLVARIPVEEVSSVGAAYTFRSYGARFLFRNASTNISLLTELLKEIIGPELKHQERPKLFVMRRGAGFVFPDQLLNIFGVK